jgi:hypothetical protein
MKQEFWRLNTPIVPVWLAYKQNVFLKNGKCCINSSVSVEISADLARACLQCA